MQELLVVLIALALIGHISSDILNHGFQHWDHLLGEMLEFLALIVKLVSGDRIIQMDLNV